MLCLVCEQTIPLERQRAGNPFCSAGHEEQYAATPIATVDRPNRNRRHALAAAGAIKTASWPAAEPPQAARPIGARLVARSRLRLGLVLSSSLDTARTLSAAASCAGSAAIPPSLAQARSAGATPKTIPWDAWPRAPFAPAGGLKRAALGKNVQTAREQEPAPRVRFFRAGSLPFALKPADREFTQHLAKPGLRARRAVLPPSLQPGSVNAAPRVSAAIPLSPGLRLSALQFALQRAALPLAAGVLEPVQPGGSEPERVPAPAALSTAAILFPKPGLRAPRAVFPTFCQSVKPLSVRAVPRVSSAVPFPASSRLSALVFVPHPFTLPLARGMMDVLQPAESTPPRAPAPESWNVASILFSKSEWRTPRAVFLTCGADGLAVCPSLKLGFVSPRAAIAVPFPARSRLSVALIFAPQPTALPLAVGVTVSLQPAESVPHRVSVTAVWAAASILFPKSELHAPRVMFPTCRADRLAVCPSQEPGFARPRVFSAVRFPPRPSLSTARFAQRTSTLPLAAGLTVPLRPLESASQRAPEPAAWRPAAIQLPKPAPREPVSLSKPLPPETAGLSALLGAVSGSNEAHPASATLSALMSMRESFTIAGAEPQLLIPPPVPAPASVWLPAVDLGYLAPPSLHMAVPEVAGLQWTEHTPVSALTLEAVSFPYFLLVPTILGVPDLSELESEQSFVQTAGFAMVTSPLPAPGTFEALPDSADFHLAPVWLPALFALTRRYALLRLRGPSPVRASEFLAASSDSVFYARGPGFSGVLAFPTRGEVCSEFPAKKRPAPTVNSTSKSSSWDALQLWRGLPPLARGITLALPLIAPAVFFLSSISLPVSAPSHAELSATIQARATVDLQEDFQTGLSAWTGLKGWESSWSIVNPGSAQPGRLAVYRPTLPLTNYTLQLQGEIEAKGLGFVFRATDLNNYYAAKLAIRKAGLVPSVYLVRYAVVTGRAGQKTETLLPMNLRSDSLYDILVTVRGADFTVTVNGQLVDTWSDNRLKLGGIGLFAEKGEIAHLRLIHVTENEDFLGWICSQVSRWNADRNGIGVKHE